VNAWHRWSFTTLSAIIAVTGAVYFWMKDLLTPEDPFAVVNHPLQPVIQHLHVLAAPAFLVVFGMVFTAHVVWKLRTRGALWPSGLLSLVTIVLMAASGYLLEVAIDEAWRGFWSGLHLASGAVFTVACAVHLTAGIRRARQKQRVRV
jgi:hypothetical protein